MKDLSLQKQRWRQKVKPLEAKVHVSLEKLLAQVPCEKSIGAYKPLRGEPDFTDLPSLVTWVWPRITGPQSMEFVNGAKFRLGSMGCIEPVGGEVVLKDQISLILVPGLAFDYKGGRLGRGKGFYDFYLKDFKGHKVGVCSSERFFFEPIPREPHDIFMDWVLTEQHLYKVNQVEKGG